MTLDQLKAELEQVKNTVPLDVVKMSNIQQQIDQLEQSQEQEQRVQKQEEQVQSIKLPFDFNDIFDNKNANEMIKELIQQFQRQANADHNAELEQVHNDNREKLRAAEEREVQLQRQNTELNHQLENESSQLAMVITDRDQARKELHQVTLELEDANSKRDAAVRELEDAKREIERLNGHIDDLRKDAAVGARNGYKVTDIAANDKLAQLVKESAAEKAARGLARWNANNPDLAVPTLGVAQPASTFPDTQPADHTVHNGAADTPDTPVVQEVTPPAVSFPEPPNTNNAEMANREQGVQQEGDATKRPEAWEADIESAIDHINARLERLEKLANLPSLGVA